VIEPLPGTPSKATARPAQLYRLSRNQVIEFDRTISANDAFRLRFHHCAVVIRRLLGLCD
jgi:hypothetical protein